MRNSTLRPVRTKKDYKAALKRVDALLDARRGSREADELEALSILIEAYESEAFPIDEPDPIAYLKFCMEAQGLEQADLARVLGSRSRASEILARKRPLTLDMIRAIGAAWHIPVEPLVRRYACVA
jgi:antitoxin component HigA of HigAB toxin-antitoxin module